MAKKRAPARKGKSKKTTASSRKAVKKKKASKKPAPKSRAAKSKGPVAIASQHIDYLTYKSTQLQKFYGEALELKTEFRDVDGLAYLVVKTSSSSSIGFMPPHPEMRADAPAPREPSLYFMVDDVDRTYTYLAAKGVAFVHPPQTMPWGHRVLTSTDPEGRTVMLAGKVEPED
jgi:predicted enzyme related to lactoylglutathione lyase